MQEIRQEIRLKPCPFCGHEQPTLQVYNPELYGNLGCAVECPMCRARTGYFGISEAIGKQMGAVTDRSLARGRMAAAHAWNMRGTETNLAAVRGQKS